MGRKEKAKDDFSKVKCPVCGKIIIKDEEYYGECPHVVLTYSDLANDFGYIDASLIDLVDEMEEKVKKRYEREEAGDDDIELEYINIPDLMFEFTQKSDNQYELISCFSEGLACGPISNTDYILFRITDKKKTKTPKKTKQSKK